MQILAKAAPLALACTFAAVPPAAVAQMIGGPGPSVASRGGNRPGERGVSAVEFTFFGGITGTYTDQFLPARLDAQGAVPRLEVFGGEVVGGVYGGRNWRRSSFGIDARSGYTRYSKGFAGLSGGEHLVSLDYSTVLSPRWQIVARTTGGSSTRAFGGFIAPSYAATDYISLPFTEVFSNRIFFLQSMAYAGYRKSSRTTITLGGGAFGTRRDSRALVNVNGYLGNARYSYRLSRNFSLGAMYDFMHFDFPRAFGGSDIHGAALVLERSVGRNISSVLKAGVYRAETLGSEAFTLNPEIAAILGRTRGTRVLYRVDYLPQIEGQLIYRRKTTSYRAGVRRGASPGNGLYLTSQTDSADAGVSYMGIRRISFSGSVAYNRMESMFSTLSAFNSVTAGGGLSIALGHGFNLTGSAEARRISAGETLRGSVGKYVSIGLMYSSSETPLSIW
ncbi:MAG TPA: hypothetical protein VFL57_21675 [Bryobacteraceae bacterium]|nr:hypothetical protein [Bryobacteraceae bacterium]